MVALIIGFQVVLFLGGIVPTYFLNRNDDLSKWGPVLGLIAQPFFITSGIITQQWGIAGAAAINGVFFGYGVYKDWFEDKIKARQKK